MDRLRLISLHPTATQSLKDGFHSRAVLSQLVVASRAPSGLNATPYTVSVWPVRGAPWGWPVATSHNRTVRSKLAVASRASSGLNATPYTVLVWPVRGAPWGWLVATSHNRTVLSPLVVASRA